MANKDTNKEAAPQAAIIVESPAKTKTLARFLGSEYKLLASGGHVRDLPEDELAVDVERNFAPHYVIIPQKRKTISQLKKELKDVSLVYLASDPDREGEAIAWHLAQVLGLQDPKRIEFNEITEPAVKAALQQPRPIDMRRVHAQQARRILDRLVGYQISPLLWRKIAGAEGQALSAGRVQSAALRLICDREREIAAFVPEEYWTLSVQLSPAGAAQTFRAEVKSRNGQELAPKSEAETQPLVAELQRAAYVVQGIEEKTRTRKPQPPFITSTLQRAAASALGFSARKTMILAEQLYQGVELGEEGPIGLITYIRTDSTRVAEQAVAQARAFITEHFGEEYVGPGVRGKAVKGAQEAHEAIRPTAVTRTPEAVRPYLNKDQAALYELIWRRFVASQMAPAQLRQLVVEIAATPDPNQARQEENWAYELRATASAVAFAGFLAVLPEKDEKDEKDREEEEKEEDTPFSLLQSLQPGQGLQLWRVMPEQHFTKPPPRYTEASLVQAMEEHGIGRPSTYATIIETLRQRKYVRMKERAFVPTPLGFAVCDYLSEYFPHVVDVAFTSRVEADLDQVEEGELDWIALLRPYYEDLQAQLQAAEQAGPQVLEGQSCPQCGGRLLIRYGVRGKFAGCENFPRCKYLLDLTPQKALADKPEPVGRNCPQCGAELLYRSGYRGQRFISCSAFPRCQYKERLDAEGNAEAVTPPQPTTLRCAKCGGVMMIKQSRRGPFLGCSNYPRCRHQEPIERLEELAAADEANQPAAAMSTAQAQASNEGDSASDVTQNEQTPPRSASQGTTTATELNIRCDQCGAPMTVRRGPRGLFVGCTAYPRCKAIKPISVAYAVGYRKPPPQLLDESCPECGQPLCIREGRKGPFIGCTAYPKCRYTRDLKAAS